MTPGSLLLAPHQWPLYLLHIFILLPIITHIISPISHSSTTITEATTSSASPHHSSTFSAGSSVAISASERQNIKDEISQMFHEAYMSYKHYAFPHDELRPLSCSGLNTWGDYSLTLIDSLDSLVIVKRDYNLFLRELHWMLHHVEFDRDVSVSIFETNIRVVGGLVSAYLLLEERNGIYRDIYQDSLNDVDGWLRECLEVYRKQKGSSPSVYNRKEAAASHKRRRRQSTNQQADRSSSYFPSHQDTTFVPNSYRPIFKSYASDLPLLREKLLDEMKHGLLRKIVDLADRILPAFETPSHIPFGSINLKHGVAEDESRLTCTAAAGTFLLEFGLLSHFTHNQKYLEVARNALYALYKSRSKDTGLVGNHVNIDNSQWTHRDAGIGGSMDSLFEYLMKGYLLFGDREYFDMFEEYFKSIQKHLYREPWYFDVDMYTGQQVWPVYNSLQSFWPGTLSSLGRFDVARESLMAFHSVWRRFGAVPEGFNVVFGAIQPNQQIYPLRPEVAESAYHMYRATGDPIYQQMGRDIVRSIAHHTRVKCGYANIRDVNTMQLEDKMESFFIAETLKYLYLLFDEENVVNQIPHTFNTEAHVIPLKFYGVHANFTQFKKDAFAMEFDGENQPFDKYQCPTAEYFSSLRFGVEGMRDYVVAGG